jgi:hypothetical protein
MPHLVKKLNGTAVVTSVGMFGRGARWGIPLPGHTLTITVGGIVCRPVVNNAQLESREHLCLTVSFDHDIVDGAIGGLDIAAQAPRALVLRLAMTSEAEDISDLSGSFLARCPFKGCLLGIDRMALVLHNIGVVGSAPQTGLAQ